MYSIYRKSAGKEKIYALYDRALNNLQIDYEERYVETRFGKTHLLITGKKETEPLLVLHGGNFLNPLSLAWFLPLAKFFKIYAPDTIGHPGKSAEIRVSPNNHSFGKWLEDVLNELQIKKACFIGPSYGAGILLRLAIYAPERIKKAVLLIPSGIINPPIYNTLIKLGLPYIFYRFGKNKKWIKKTASGIYTETPDDEKIMYLKAIFDFVKLEINLPRPVTVKDLSSFNAPVMVLAAGNDILFPGNKVINSAKKIFKNLVRTEIHPDFKHVPPADALEEINGRIVDFLQIKS